MSECQTKCSRISNTSYHRYLNNTVDTTAAAIKAGCNLELGTSVYKSTLDAMKQGKLTEKEIRDNVKVESRLPCWTGKIKSS